MKTELLKIRVEPEMKKALERLKIREDRSMSDIVRQVLWKIIKKKSW